MRILIISSPFDYTSQNGTDIGYSIDLLAKDLHLNNYDVTVISNGTVDSSNEITSIKNIRIFNEPLNRNEHIHTAYQAEALRYVINNNKSFDIVHNFNWYSSGFDKNSGLPTLYTLENTASFESAFEKAYELFPNNNYSAISNYQKVMLKQKGMNVIDYNYHGIDFDSYKQSVLSGDYITFYGDINLQSGVHYLLDIAKKESFPIKFGGEIKELEYFNSFVKPYIEGEASIEYLGTLNRLERKELIQYAKCFVYPIQWDEPYSFRLVESLALGTPIIATKTGFTQELLNKRNGLLLNKIEDLKTCIESIDFFDRKSVNLNKQFDYKEVTKKYKSLYEKLLDNMGG